MSKEYSKQAQDLFNKARLEASKMVRDYSNSTMIKYLGKIQKAQGDNPNSDNLNEYRAIQKELTEVLEVLEHLDKSIDNIELPGTIHVRGIGDNV